MFLVFYLVLILFVMFISAIILYPVFYFIPFEKRKGVNQFFLVVLVLSSLTIIVLSPFIMIGVMNIFLILTIMLASFSLIGYLYSKTNENVTNVNGRFS
ncbi:hypothetical protein SAMN05518871_103430 [Psychrobacillus sp. OK028]|nr:hypothetical protein SAMN05518871_103430 [Psychrobacillus sp. OK028]